MKGLKGILMDICEELDRAIDQYGEFSSAHEGYAVLKEELEELWKEVKVKQPDRDPEKLRNEALQLAAMAVKFILYVDDGGSEK